MQDRVAKAREQATSQLGAEACLSLIEALNQGAGVVVSLPASVARHLIVDPRQLFQNYEHLVGGGMRSPAKPEHDRARKAVAGVLFGTYGEHIGYGALSLSGRGVRSYGPIFCRLRDVAIRDRTSFLEMNSFDFVRVKQLKAGDVPPPGHRAVWDNRVDLALAKHTSDISNSDTLNGWERRLIRDGADRSADDFIEAHFYGPFNADAIQALECAAGDLRKDERLDAEIILELFAKRRGDQTGGTE